MATILIVDNYLGGRKYLAALLAHRNHRILEASDGAEALALARQVPLNLIITDLRMPGMSGSDLIQALRADPDTAHIPVLAHTVHTTEYPPLGLYPGIFVRLPMAPHDLDVLIDKALDLFQPKP